MSIFEYFKFWVAEGLAGLFWVMVVFGLVGSIFVGLVVFDWLKGKLK